MSERVTMPALGESVTEGTVTRWLKNVGDTVAVDEPLVEVSTDKVDTEVPSPVAGTLQEILADEDETIEVGADMCVIGDGDAPSDSGSEGGSTEEKKDEEGAQPESAESAEETPAEPSAASEAPAEDAPKQSSGGTSGGDTVKMPALGESVTEGTVTRWLKSEGDDVEVDEPLLEVSTDKVDTEIPSPFAGKLTSILVGEDETVEVGADLAVIGGSAAEAPKQEAPKEEAPKQEAPKQEAPKEEAPKEQTPKQEAPKQEAPKEEAPKQEAPKQEDKDDASAYVTPLVRKLAADNGVDLSTLKGTGVGGRIRKQDVLEAAKATQQQSAPAQSAPAQAPAQSAPAAPAAAAPKAPAAPAPVSEKRGTREKMTRLRKVIAERMTESLQTSAQLTNTVEVDMGRVAALRAAHKQEFQAREGAKLSYLPFVTLATIEALKTFPQLNSTVEGDEIVYPAAEHIGIAVDTDRGLLVPVMKDAGDLNIAGIARKIADLAARTRSNKVTPDELTGGTFTISNIGSNGSVTDTCIINQPQVGILGTGAIVKRPAVVTDAEGNEAIAIRPIMTLCLTYDHRVVDGALAGRFLTAIKKRLEEGAFEV